MPAHSVHARLPGILADLHSAWEIWLEFALEVGAIHCRERADLERRSRRVLQQVAEIQSAYHQGSDPALRFLALLRAALAQGRAHVADRRGAAPESAQQSGWSYDARQRTWVPQGARIG